MLRGLEDLVVRVVAEPGLRQAVAEAALAGVEVRNRVPGAGTVRALVVARGGGVRNPAIRRVDDERRAPARVPGRAAVQPEVVVEAGRAVVPPIHVAAGRRGFGGAFRKADVARHGGVFQRGDFLCRKVVPPLELRRPLERRKGGTDPDTLQVRISPRRPGRGARRFTRDVGQDRGPRPDLAVEYDFETLDGAAERAQPGVGAKRTLVVSVVGFGVRLVPALLALRACLLEVWRYPLALSVRCSTSSAARR